MVAGQLELSKSATLELVREHRTEIRPRIRLSYADVIKAAEVDESGLYLRQVAEHFGVSTECARKRLIRPSSESPFNMPPRSLSLSQSGLDHAKDLGIKMPRLTCQ